MAGVAEKEGARVKVETITLSFVQVSLCVRVFNGERKEAVWRVTHLTK